MPAQDRGRRWLTIAGLLLPAIAILLLPTRQRSSPACRPTTFEGSRFTLCLASRGRVQLRLISRGADGQPLRSFARLAAMMGKQTPVFAMNAGMLDANGRPIGLSIEDRVQRQSLNLNNGPGNFHMKPNGVFFGDANGWRIATSDEFARQPPANPLFATQSGPMLVIHGKLHPGFSVDGASRYIRNGVGIDRRGAAWFAISDESVSFGRFARLFRDRLGCGEALYLDGYVSSLWDPGAGRLDQRAPLGSIIVAEGITSRR